MAEMWKPLDIEVYKAWIDQIVDEASDELNDWENSFIFDIGVKLDQNFQLTENQANKLESIYSKYTS